MDTVIERWQAYFIGTAASLIVWMFVVYQYGKFSPVHNWWGVPIFFIATIALLIAGLVGWYATSSLVYASKLSFKPMVISIVGLIVITFVGIHYTEPSSQTVQTRGISRQESYSYSDTRSGNWYFSFGGGSSSSGSSSSSDAFDDMDGEGVLALLLILVVIALIIGSAFVPHLWVVAGAIMLGLLMSFTVWQIMERRPDRGYAY